MHDIRKTYDKLFPFIKNFSCNLFQNDGNIKRTGPKPKFSDIEVITLALTAEILNIDSENLLFKKLLALSENDQFHNLIDRSQFNVRRRNLKLYIERIRQQMVNRLVEYEDTFIIDSIPIEICKFIRAKRIKICKENMETSPDFGYSPSQNITYYGYKLHSLCSLNGVITSFDFTKANVHDIHYLQDVKEHYSNCRIIGDRGYLSYQIQVDLFESANIKLETPMRINQINFKRFPFIFRKCRKRIETVYSQLCDQFLLRRNYAKSFSGLTTRILSKITAFTLLQYLNKFVLNRPIGHVKHAFI
jgi:hypothetical protein